MPAQPAVSQVDVQGHRLEVQEIPGKHDGEATLVFLHEGLGSVSMWRGFPEKVADLTGCRTIAYSRYGYGQSDVLRGPRKADYMHVEALQVLPELLQELAVAEPILVGHSDGGSIALVFAGGGHAARGLVVMAPHVFVEDISVSSIAEAKAAYETTDLRARLARHHADADATFRGWNDIWLAPEFRGWNIESYLPGVTCPLLAIQGFDDEYGTMAQVDAVAHQVSGPVEVLRLSGCRHSPHRDQPAAVLEAISNFVERVRERG